MGDFRIARKVGRRVIAGEKGYCQSVEDGEKGFPQSIPALWASGFSYSPDRRPATSCAQILDLVAF
jgi:hypothetical protein